MDPYKLFNDYNNLAAIIKRKMLILDNYIFLIN